MVRLGVLGRHWGLYPSHLAAEAIAMRLRNTTVYSDSLPTALHVEKAELNNK